MCLLDSFSSMCMSSDSVPHFELLSVSLTDSHRPLYRMRACVLCLLSVLGLQIFANGGLGAASVTLLISAWLACDNMMVLIECAELTGKTSYGQV